MRNPFWFGTPPPRPQLAGRGTTLELVERTAQSRGRLFLIGPRRYGKTSVLWCAAARLAAREVVVLRQDAEVHEGVERLAEALLSSAVRALAGNLDAAMDALRRHFGALRPELSVAVGGEVRVTLGAANRIGAELAVLTTVLDGIDRLAGESGRAVVVAIDEVQGVLRDGRPDAESRLRQAVDRHGHVAYIFAGSDTRLLEELTASPGRGFYRSGVVERLEKLPRPALRELIETGFAEAGFRAEDGAVDGLLDAAEEVPYNVQQLAHRAWEDLRSGGNGRLTAQSVERALDWVVHAQAPFHTRLWLGLSRQQKRTLRALVGEGGRELYSSDVARRYDIPTPSLQSALRKLDGVGLVREERTAAGRRHVLEDPFFGAWIRSVPS